MLEDRESQSGRVERCFGLNRLTPFHFVLAFGVVSMLAEMVYEGARAIIGPYLATFGESAAVLAIPGALTLLTLAWLRRAVPRPPACDPVHHDEPTHEGGGFAALPRRFWLYAVFTALSMLGFATFAVLAYHQEVTRVIEPALIPVTFAAAMGADALAALGSGRLYDSVGLRGLIIALPLAAIVPALSFSEMPALVWIGAIVWGAVMGIHESTLRAAVADLVPATFRGTGYGVFTAIYGLAWLAGSMMIGTLYSYSLVAVTAFVVATQVAALFPSAMLIRGSGGQ
jgi:Major Facilitator Superfamily